MKIHMAGSEWFETRPGGLNRYFTSLYEALRARPGLDVTATAFGIPSRGGSSWGSPSGSLPLRTAKSIIRERPQAGAVVDRHFAAYGPGKPFVRPDRRPLVVHFQGPWFAESLEAGAGRLSVRVKHAIEQRRYARADRAVVLSSAFAEILTNEFSYDASRVRVIPPGVNLSRFTASMSRSDEPMVLCVRRLERRMGIDVLLKAWTSVVQSNPEVTLTVVGTGSEESTLRELAGRLGVADSVRFAGRAGDDELAALYSAAWFTVVPTTALEGFGLIALESLASGKSPIVTRCGGLPDSVVGLDPSLIVEPGDAEQLAERINRALEGHLPTAEQARAHAETFSWTRVAAEHEKLYRELAP